VIHAKRSEFVVLVDGNGNRTVTYKGSIDPRSVVIPFDLLRSEVARQNARANAVTGIFDDHAYCTAISLGAAMMNIHLDD
jgi:hypothetical protein